MQIDWVRKAIDLAISEILFPAYSHCHRFLSGTCTSTFKTRYSVSWANKLTKLYTEPGLVYLKQLT